MASFCFIPRLQVPTAIAAAVVEAEARQEPANPLIGFLAREMRDARVEAQVVLGGEALVEAGVLEQRAGAAADLLPVGRRIEAQHARGAGGWLDDAEEEMDGGGFAGAVRPEEGEDRAFGNGEGRGRVDARGRCRNRGSEAVAEGSRSGTARGRTATPRRSDRRRAST